jgi:hypothetical protein
MFALLMLAVGIAGLLMGFTYFAAFELGGALATMARWSWVKS